MALTGLVQLSLNRCYRVTDTGLQSLAQLPLLEHLDLGGEPGYKLQYVTDTGLRWLRQLQNLTWTVHRATHGTL